MKLAFGLQLPPFPSSVQGTNSHGVLYRTCTRVCAHTPTQSPETVSIRILALIEIFVPYFLVAASSDLQLDREAGGK